VSEENTSDEDEDWFESALDDESEETPATDDDPFGGEDTDDAGDPFEDDDGGLGDTDDGGFADTDDGAIDSPFGDTDTTEDAFTDADAAESDSDSPFGDSGAAEDAFGEAEAETGDESGDSPFGDTGTGDDSPFDSGGGFGEEDDDDNLFDDDFSSAMGSAGGGDSDFDDEDFESDIPRIDIGIEGLDNMIMGGIPERHLAVVIGGAGTGKTTFGLQFLHHGLQKDDPDRGVFITLEQSYDDIMATANESGWEFDHYEEQGNLAVVDLDPVEMANSLDNIRGELPQLIEDFDADRFVLDSVSLLEMMYDDQAQRRTEVFDFTQSLKDAGVTTMFTSEASDDNPYVSRHGIIEYLTDAVFLLRYVRKETQETRLAVEIQKIRNANHSRETKPYELTRSGIDVHEQATIF
jgi:circadian clock protein KaiC